MTSVRVKSSGPWIGVDLDGTLAEYRGWKGVDHIGVPIPAMLARVKAWLVAGKEVRIFTARVSHEHDAEQAKFYIEQWCLEHVGRILPVTNVKDFGMTRLWDDRAAAVQRNTGRATYYIGEDAVDE